MVFAPGLDVGGGRNLADVDRHAGDRNPALLSQLVALVERLQIVAMPAGGQVRRVAIPVKQVERRRVLPQQIIVDDIIPDKVAAAQQVEGRRHVAPVEKAFLGGQLARQPHRLVAEEQLQIAGEAEVDLGGEEGRALDLVRLPLGPEISERRGERRPGNAIADCVDRLDPERSRMASMASICPPST